MDDYRQDGVNAEGTIDRNNWKGTLDTFGKKWIAGC